MPLHHASNHAPSRRHHANPMASGTDPAAGATLSPPVHRLAEAPVAPDTAYQLVHDELLLDGNARLNLATFVTTWM